MEARETFDHCMEEDSGLPESLSNLTWVKILFQPSKPCAQTAQAVWKPDKWVCCVLHHPALYLSLQHALISLSNDGRTITMKGDRYLDSGGRNGTTWTASGGYNLRIIIGTTFDHFMCIQEYTEPILNDISQLNSIAVSTSSILPCQVFSPVVLTMLVCGVNKAPHTCSQ